MMTIVLSLSWYGQPYLQCAVMAGYVEQSVLRLIGMQSCHRPVVVTVTFFLFQYFRVIGVCADNHTPAGETKTSRSSTSFNHAAPRVYTTGTNPVAGVPIENHGLTLRNYGGVVYTARGSAWIPPS